MLPSMRPARRLIYRGMPDTLFGDDENAQVWIPDYMLTSQII